MNGQPGGHLGRGAGRRGGFTLVEILIVVVILGILAGIVIPQFSNASQVSRENTLKDELRYLRTQIIVYKAQHNDVAPGYPGGNPGAAPTPQAFIDQMTLPTDARGNTSPTPSDVYKFGPYLSKSPANPVNASATFLLVGNGQGLPAADGSTGFLYQPQTETILPNLTGNDSSGTAFSNY